MILWEWYCTLRDLAHTHTHTHVHTHRYTYTKKVSLIIWMTPYIVVLVANWALRKAVWWKGRAFFNPTNSFRSSLFSGNLLSWYISYTGITNAHVLHCFLAKNFDRPWAQSENSQKNKIVWKPFWFLISDSLTGCRRTLGCRRELVTGVLQIITTLLTILLYRQISTSLSRWGYTVNQKRLRNVAWY